MTLRELLLVLTEYLDRNEAKYFVTGSLAAMAYGEFRATVDVDVAVDLRFGEAADLLQLFRQPEYYLEPKSLYSAMEHCDQFNIIHPTSGFKIDVMVPTDDAFNASRFARRRRMPVQNGKTAWFAAPEDVILKKLQYYREGQSDKHLRDIGSMLKISGDVMDFEYMEKWAKELKVEDLWVKCKGRVGM